MSGAYLAASDLLKTLEQRQPQDFGRCLEALGDAERGQQLRPTDPRGALAVLQRAYDVFAQIPLARTVQGVAAAEIAAAYAQLEDYQKAMPYAREAIVLVSGVSRLVGTEAAANMTLGICLYQSNDVSGGRTCFHTARRLGSHHPEPAQFLSILDHNEAVFERSRRSWWRFWQT